MARPICRSTSVFAIILVVIVVLDETKEQPFVHTNGFERGGYVFSLLTLVDVITKVFQLLVNYLRNRYSVRSWVRISSRSQGKDLHGKIRNDDFQRNTSLQHCWDIVSNGLDIAPIFQRCVELKIVVANRLVSHDLNRLFYFQCSSYSRPSGESVGNARGHGQNGTKHFEREGKGAGDGVAFFLERLVHLSGLLRRPTPWR